MDGPLFQMALTSSHQVDEIRLFNCIRQNLKDSGKYNDVMEKALVKLTLMRHLINGRK